MKTHSTKPLQNVRQYCAQDCNELNVDRHDYDCLEYTIIFQTLYGYYYMGIIFICLCVISLIVGAKSKVRR